MRRLLRDTTILAALLGLLTTLFLTSAVAAKAPPHSLYWGAWIGDQVTGEEAPWDMSAVTDVERKLGKGLSLIEFAAPLAECSEAEGRGRCSFPRFPTKPMQTIRDYGAIPFLSWSTAATPESARQPDFQLSDMTGRRYDRQIRAFARGAAAWGHPFFLRFDWEMNGNWFPWGTHVNGNRPRQFVRSWRHVHRIFEGAGATNVTWVWCPYVEPEGQTRSLARFYPGSKYVDWTCIDAYNFGQNASNPRPWRSFSTLLRPTYQAITRKIAPGKPMVLGELASNGPPRRKARWIRQMFQVLPRSFRAISGLVWFDKIDRDLNWPLEVHRAPARAFRTGLRRDPFAANGFSELDASPIPAPR